MLTVHMIWIQGGDGFIWLHDAWEDDTMAENGPGWREALDKADKDAKSNGGTYRVQIVKVPKVHELFKVPTVEALVPPQDEAV